MSFRVLDAFSLGSLQHTDFAESSLRFVVVEVSVSILDHDLEPCLVILDRHVLFFLSEIVIDLFCAAPCEGI